MAKIKMGFAIEEGQKFNKGYLLFSTKCPMPQVKDPASTKEKPLPYIDQYDSPEAHVSGWMWDKVKRAMEHGRDMLKIEATSAYDGDLDVLRDNLT